MPNHTDACNHAVRAATRRQRAARRRCARRPDRRGVASVLSMMFLVIFGSLAAAMAVVAQGNLRTAESGLRVSRAMSAAETGLVFAARRLESETRRFVVKKGVIDADYAEDLWMGNLDSNELVVLAPTGYTSPEPANIMEAVYYAHVADTHDVVIDPGDNALPSTDEFGTVRSRPIPLSDAGNAAYFRLRYELVAGEPLIRVTSIGVDGDISRTLQMDFRLDKRIEYAVISPTRIMIGKNVMIEGPLGSLYGGDPATEAQELGSSYGDPLVMRSDFYHLDATLDSALDDFHERIVDYDVDGDARLRPEHPTESDGLGGYTDYDGNEYVDDFDLFLSHYDSNNDLVVVYDASRAAAAGLGVLSEEFDVDMQLARLIDESIPDRDGDGVDGTASDIGLGYKDGVLDINDRYAKITGQLEFAVARETWENYHGESYQTVVNGPVESEVDDAPVLFEVPEDEMRQITTDMFFDGSETWFEQQVPDGPDDFNDQVQDSINAGDGTYTAPGDAGHPGWEPVPYGSAGAYDFYNRPIYEGMTFRDVRIPMGNNGLFVDCTFIGVTFIEAETDCDHIHWNYAGAVDSSGAPRFEDAYGNPLLPAELSDGTVVPDTRVLSNNIRFHNCTFLGTLAGDRLGSEPYTYTHWRNKLQMTGNTRFYLYPDDPDVADQDDAAELTTQLNSISADDREEMAKSSMLLPGWSVDVGNFTNDIEADPEDTPKVKLKGTIIAGILDVRGTADIFGTMMMTFRPEDSKGPLELSGGRPHAFNTTIGYFEQELDGEGDDLANILAQGFGEIRLRYDPDAVLPDGIPWPVSIFPEPESYYEGGN